MIAKGVILPQVLESELNNQPQSATIFLDSADGDVKAKRADGTIQEFGGGSGGDVVGPASASENSIPVYDSGTGKSIGTSLVFIETTDEQTEIYVDRNGEAQDQGQDVSINASPAKDATDAVGGRVNISAGNSKGSANGAQVRLSGSAAEEGGTGGHVTLAPGDSATGNAGDVILTPGFSGTNGLGNVVLEDKDAADWIALWGAQGMTFKGDRGVNFTDDTFTVSVLPPENLSENYQIRMPELEGEAGDVLTVVNPATGETRWASKVVRYTLTSDDVKKETDGISQLAELSVPVEANKKYKITYYIATTSSAQPNYQLYCNYPAAYTTVDWGSSGPNEILNNYTTRTPANNTVGLFIISSITGGSGSANFYAILQNGANAGSLDFRWLSKSLGDVNTTLYAGSFVEVEEI